MGSTSVVSAFQKLLHKNLPPGLSTKPANLYQILSRYPVDGIGQRIYQTRWATKGIVDCYWVVTRTSLKKGGTHGKAWGRLVWRGKEVSPREERIRGGLKYTWKHGVSCVPIAPTTPVVP
ncbi:hypothetical protein B0F90DRAFT_1687772 [Multifurca ochricompacta]|uniref:Uncharacterized protein n=1 Tax=Multifurca ochricompacta TaxID=376703 RepID=A0AAD4MCZ5_9AGAM|nr:hypothetical protein B0F90DRAFT_1687772 [Multifurca ochricompacta]